MTSGSPPPGPPQESRHAALGATLHAVAREVEDLARICDQLQGPMSAAFVAAAADSLDRMEAFQGVDLLVQRLQGVAAYLGACAELAPDDWRLDVAPAAARLSLADLVTRLTRLDAPEAAGRPAPPRGDLELFG